MENEQIKKIRKYYRLKTKSNKHLPNPPNATYLDRLFMRIFFSAVCLLAITIVMRVIPQSEAFIMHNLSSQMNVLKIANGFTGLFNTQLLGDTAEVIAPTFYDQVIFEDETNHVYNETFEGVKCLEAGVVVSIKKHDECYDITILTSSGTSYCYQNLKHHDLRIYSYVETSEIIGGATYEDGYYQFQLTILRDDISLSYEDLFQD